jgi:hypothetical protein
MALQALVVQLVTENVRNFVTHLEGVFARCVGRTAKELAALGDGGEGSKAGAWFLLILV